MVFSGSQRRRKGPQQTLVTCAASPKCHSYLPVNLRQGQGRDSSQNRKVNPGQARSNQSQTGSQVRTGSRIRTKKVSQVNSSQTKSQVKVKSVNLVWSSHLLVTVPTINQLISQESVSEITLRYQLIYWYLICLIRLSFASTNWYISVFLENRGFCDCGGRPTGEGPSRPENMAGNA